MKKFFVAALLLLTLISCTSFQELVTPEIGGLPSWVSNPPVRRDRVGFVASGYGSSENEARAEVLKVLLQQVSEDLGRDAYNLYYRELSTTGRIEELDGTTDRTYYDARIDGSGTYYVLVSFDEEKYDAFRTEEQTLAKERENRIASYIEDANRAYRENRDFDAYECVLDALLVSLEGPVNNEEYGSDALLEEAIYYLSPLEIHVSRKGKDASAEIRVVRNRGFLSPAVVDAPVIGYYRMRNTLGEESLNGVEARTDEKGRYYFNSTNPYILRTGEISFALWDAEDRLAKIDRMAPEGFSAPLHELMDQKVVSYEYDVRGRAEERDLDVVFVEYGADGSDKGTTDAVESFNAYMDECQVDVVAVKGSGEEEEDVYANYLASGDTHGNVAIVRIGVAESESADDKEIVRVESYVSIYDNSSGNIIYSDDSAQAIGYGVEMSMAEQDAFSQAGRIIASLLLIVI